MNKQTTTIILALCLLMLLPAAVPAQGRPPGGRGPGGDRQGPPPDHRGPGGRPGGPPGSGGQPFGGPPPFVIISQGMRFDGPPVKGVPFSAVIELEMTQTLMDGTSIRRTSNGALFRDTEGRVRREMTQTFLGPVTPSEPLQMAFINDPVKGAFYALDTRKREYRQTEGSPRPSFGGPPGGREEQTPKTEALGKRAIEGVEAEGTRSSFTIPAGQMGNDRPIEIFTETWEATELKTTVLSIHSDPRAGKTTFRLVNIKRGAPDKSVFEIPADYTFRKNDPSFGPPTRGGGRPGGPPWERGGRPGRSRPEPPGENPG
ncbi:MAG: hypothetical protein ACKV2V_07500 [Blastocatellia bacterium]